MSCQGRGLEGGYKYVAHQLYLLCSDEHFHRPDCRKSLLCAQSK